MLVAAAVLPHPPVLVPSVASGAAAELNDLRTQCRVVLDTVGRVAADVTFVVGVDGGVRATTFAPWGADLAVDVPEPLPLPLLVGAWLTAGHSRSFVVIDDELNAHECAAIGADLAASSARVALVVMGDGSARHSEKAPGYLDDRARAYDDAVAIALRDADAAALLSLEPSLARELQVAGRAPWQVLAGAAGERHWNATGSMSAPYGVAYHVAAWT